MRFNTNDTVQQINPPHKVGRVTDATVVSSGERVLVLWDGEESATLEWTDTLAPVIDENPTCRLCGGSHPEEECTL